MSRMEFVDFIPIHRYRPSVSIYELQEYEQSVKLFESGSKLLAKDDKSGHWWFFSSFFPQIIIETVST